MSKRGQNEGSIIQRKDGRWMGRVTLPNGKRMALYGSTREDVAGKLVTALADARAGRLVGTERQTVAAFLDDWLVNTVKSTVRPGTYASYESLVRVHIVPALGTKQLTKLTPQQVQKLLNSKLAEGLSARTVQYIHRVLHMALSQALQWGQANRNVAALVKPPRVRREEVQPLSPEQARTLLEAVKDDRLSALYTVAMALGLRQGEALGLRWEDVDLQVGTLRVSHALRRMDGQLVEPKTDRSRRVIAMPAIVVTALREHRIRQLEERLQAGQCWEDQGLVFCTEIGTPLGGWNVTRWFQQLAKQAGLGHVRFHDLRHTAASLLLAQGVSPRIIMETLGHSQIGMTMNLYAHVMPALQREAAVQMDAILGGK